MQHFFSTDAIFFSNCCNIFLQWSQHIKKSLKKQQSNAAPAYIGHFVEREGDGSGGGGLRLRAGDRPSRAGAVQEPSQGGAGARGAKHHREKHHLKEHQNKK